MFNRLPLSPCAHVAWRILAYSVLTVAVSLLLWPAANTGWLYPIVALVAGLAMLAEAVALLVRAKRGLNLPTSSYIRRAAGAGIHA